MDVGDWETARVTFGVDGAETNKTLTMLKQRNIVRSLLQGSISSIYSLTNSNSRWTNSRTWKMSGESTYSYVVAVTSCEAMGYVILGYTSTNIHTPLIDNCAFVIFCLVDYAISSYKGP